jgi:chemotaxis signal transduction protein
VNDKKNNQPTNKRDLILNILKVKNILKMNLIINIPKVKNIIKMMLYINNQKSIPKMNLMKQVLK